MVYPQTDRDPVLARRAARARRSKWLGSLLFSLTGMALLLVLRLNPEVVETVVAHAHDVPPRAEPEAFDKPAKVTVRQMPRNVVPVRRGGLPPKQPSQRQKTQAQADEVARTLRGLSPGS